MATAPAPRTVAPAEQPIYWHALQRQTSMNAWGPPPRRAGARGGGPQARELRLQRAGCGPPPHVSAALLAQFNDFIVIILSWRPCFGPAGDYVEAIAIIAIVILNAVLAWSKRGAPRPPWRRCSSWPHPGTGHPRRHRTSSRARAGAGRPGGARGGQQHPADLRLVETANLRVEEAALTGESHAWKDASLVLAPGCLAGRRRNSAFWAPCRIVRAGLGLVSSVGMNTQIGMIPGCCGHRPGGTPLQRRLANWASGWGSGALVICGLVFLRFVRGFDPWRCS